MPKRNPEEIWRQVLDEAADDEIERAASVSVAQAEKELAAAGFDVAAERAIADALIRRVEAESQSQGSGRFAVVGVARQSPVQLVTPVRAVEFPRPTLPVARKRWGVLLAAATLSAGVIAAAASTIVIQLAKHRDIGPDRGEASIASNQERATGLRRDAVHACSQQRWLQCRQGLDAAKALDPPGDESQDIQTWRRAIDSALEGPNNHAVPQGPDKK